MTSNHIAKGNDPRFDQLSDPFNPEIFSEDYQKLIELQSIFEKYDPLQLISTISGMQLFPINQTHIIRLEVASRVASLCHGVGKKILDRNRIKKTLNNYLPTNSCFGRNEDPPEYPFTSNIQFYGGNYVVYTGAYPIESFIVQTLLEEIYFKREEFPEHFFLHVYSAAMGILNISNQIAKRNKHIRYLTSKDDQGNQIRIPQKELLSTLANSLIFTGEEFSEIATSRGFLIESILQFSLPKGHNLFSNSNPQQNPLFNFPIVQYNSNYIVAAPTSLLATLRRFIIISAEKFECKDFLLKEYNKRIISKNKEWLYNLGHKNINLTLPEWENIQNITEWSCKIDQDKVAHVFFVSQETSQISGRDYYEYWEIQDNFNKISNRIEKINSILNQDHQICIFYIIINNFTSWYKFNPPEFDNISYIILNYDDLYYISNIDDLNNLSLFKYSIAEKNSNTPELMSWSFIDRFAYYLDHGCSFYSSDEKRDGIILWPGYGHDLRKKVSEITDHHVMISLEPNHFIPVKRLHPEDTTLPLYKPNLSIDKETIGIEGFNQTIWVTPNSSLKEGDNGENLLQSISEMIASWILEIKPFFNNLISSKTNNIPIVIDYNIEQIQKWQEIQTEYEFENIEREDFNFCIQEKRILLTIPLKLKPYFLKDNNEGERIFLLFFLDALIELFSSLSEEKIIRENNQEIVDKFAPYGNKKFIHFLNTANNPFVELSGIIPPRLIDEACYQIELDNLGLLLKTANPEAKRFFNETNVNKKIHIIVEILHKSIIEQISQFEYDSILPYAISQYESILVYRNLYQQTLPAKLNLDPTNSQTTEIEINNHKKVDRTSHAVRILIEIISAQPPKGKNLINNFEYDAIIAKIILLLEFAFFSEIVEYKVGYVDLDLLKSGRIGMASDYSNKWELFYNEKMSEHITNILMARRNPEPGVDNYDQFITDLDEGFREEYGYSYSDLFDFTSTLYQLVDGSKAYCILPLSEFIQLIIDRSKLKEETVQLLLDNLSLKNRKKWENPPNGYTSSDIFPWLFNRRLSYLIRPLIINQNEAGEIAIIWGKRQVLFTSKHIIDLIFSGRYQKFVKSDKINGLIGNTINENSHQFVVNLSTLLQTIDGFIVETEIPIKPKKIFSNEIDIGDIDILVIDIRNSIIYIIECKDMSFSRTPREIATEIQEFTDPTINNYLKKHLKRVDWIIQNISTVIDYFKIPEKKYQTVPLLVTSEEIPVPFFKNIDIPLLSYTSIKNLIKNTNYPNKSEGFKLLLREKRAR